MSSGRQIGALFLRAVLAANLRTAVAEPEEDRVRLHGGDRERRGEDVVVGSNGLRVRGGRSRSRSLACGLRARLRGREGHGFVVPLGGHQVRVAVLRSEGTGAA